MQTSVPAVDTKVAHDSAAAPLSCGLGVPGGKPAKLSQIVDPERALYLGSTPPPLQSTVLLAQGPKGDTLICTLGDHERALYTAPASLQPQSASSLEGPGSQQKRLSSATLEILKGPYTQFQPLPTTVCE